MASNKSKGTQSGAEKSPEVKIPSGEFYVYSTLSNDQAYTQWEVSTDGAPHIATGRVLIRGKVNVTDKHFHTPKGVVTVITGEQLAKIERSGSFQRHKKAGYIKVERKKADPEAVAKADMTAKDASAQLTKKDFENPDKVKTNASAAVE